MGIPQYVSHFTSKVILMAETNAGRRLPFRFAPARSREDSNTAGSSSYPIYQTVGPPKEGALPLPAQQQHHASDTLLGKQQSTMSVNPKLMTSAHYSRFYITNPKPFYSIGEEVNVVIEARDDLNRPKTVGGDLFRARMLSREATACQGTDELLDLGDGRYEATFTTRWPGEAKIDVSLVHAAEGLAVIKDIASSFPTKMVYIARFGNSKNAETRRCNVFPPEYGEFCNFTNPVSGVPWYCQKPVHPGLSCGDWRWSQSDETATAALKRALLGNQNRATCILRYRQRLNNQNVETTISVDVNNALHVTEFPWQNNSLPPCRPGQLIGKSPMTGYYYHDTWYSLHCKIRRRWTAENVTNCLRNTTLQIIGDSSARQIYHMMQSMLQEQFTSSRHDFLHESEERSGPLWDIDGNNGIEIRFNFHGFPIGGSNWFNRSNIMDAARRLDRMQPSRNRTIIVMTIGAHFTYHNLDLYENRLRIVKAALDRLFVRIPNVLVIMKSMTPREFSDVTHIEVNSEWWMWRLDQSMRKIIASDPRIALIDAWGMTRAMLFPYDVHPHETVIANFVSQILSYACPTKR
ncbi:NXPE family member 3-like [Diadema antillarum]|uniref:NXPE family member 3-like n=1 Tax=Diadema antillarum TaxID=105358 RepID=UPI003A8C2D4D